MCSTHSDGEGVDHVCGSSLVGENRNVFRLLSEAGTISLYLS